MKKSKYKGIAFLMAMLLFINATPIWGAESTTVDSAVANYMSARALALVFGETGLLKDCSVVGIVADEREHYEALKAENINVVASSYEVISTEGDDIEVEVELEEIIYYLQDGEVNSEIVFHMLSLIYDDENAPVVVSDSYYEEYSEFISASYVNPVTLFLIEEAGSEQCIVSIAETQVGYLEKETNANLEEFTANAGNGNYTKYGKWFGKNGVAWCAIFVAWCANQSNVSTSIIKKTASCDSSMNFFKKNGRFYESKAYGGDYVPQAGDIFFYGPNESDATHTGIVVGVSSSKITVIHGNSKNQVRQSTYSLTNTKLLGFGNPDYQNSEHSFVEAYDTTSHWEECSACGKKINIVEHIFDLKQDGTGHWEECTECGYSSISESHNYEYNYNTICHWAECCVCGYKSVSMKHTMVSKMTSTSRWTECSICGYKSLLLSGTQANVSY